MRVLHFAPKYPELTQTFVKNFVDKSTDFAEAAVATFRNPDTPDMGDNYPVYALPRHHHRKSVTGFMKYALHTASRKVLWDKPLDKVMEQFQPDVVHCHFGHIGVFFHQYLVRTQKSVPFVTSFYGVDASSRPLRCPQYYQDLQLLWRASDRYLVEGPALGEKLAKLNALPERISVNPLLLSTEAYPNRLPVRSADTIKFLLVGRFVEKKGFHHFLEAMGRIQDQMPAFSISIIGGGEMEERYREIITRFGMKQKVHFLGWQPHQAVMQHLKEHDFFVHPSVTAQDGDSEGGAPTILLEAQTVGIPVISTNHADIPFVMAYHDFLADEGSISSLEKKLLLAVHYPAWDHLLELGKKKVRANHDLKTSNQYFHLLQEVCASQVFMPML
uniref:Glycosyltransferase n=1 Tax=Roseihalotalea indica TaxID=2867963 RepID=A0AA49GL97_9BACT|nr:glycosyltransferase [Tunicatimonas sp. TK19036]